MLTVKNLSLIKGKKQQSILRHINLEIVEGSISLLLGASGAGKSSLLRCLAQLEKGYQGGCLVGLPLNFNLLGKRSTCSS